MKTLRFWLALILIFSAGLLFFSCAKKTEQAGPQGQVRDIKVEDTNLQGQGEIKDERPLPDLLQSLKSEDWRERLLAVPPRARHVPQSPDQLRPDRSTATQSRSDHK